MNQDKNFYISKQNLEENSKWKQLHEARLLSIQRRRAVFVEEQKQNGLQQEYVQKSYSNQKALEQFYLEQQKAEALKFYQKSQMFSKFTHLYDSKSNNIFLQKFFHLLKFDEVFAGVFFLVSLIGFLFLISQIVDYIFFFYRKISLNFPLFDFKVKQGYYYVVYIQCCQVCWINSILSSRFSKLSHVGPI